MCLLFYLVQILSKNMYVGDKLLCGKFNWICNKSGVMKRVINNYVVNLLEIKIFYYVR